MSGVSYPYAYWYETIAASQTAQVLGATASSGAKGDYIHRLIISVVTAASATVTLIDGSTSIVILTGGATVIPGIYSVELNMAAATGPWKITTGSGVTVVAVGIFTA
jgi:hypothetical protein